MNKRSIQWSEKWILGLMLFGIGLIYFIHLPVSYDFDGTVFSHYLRYALLKNDLAATAQPHHPLYMPVNYLIYKGLNAAVGYNVLEYFHLQLFSLCFGLLTLWVSYKIIKQMTDRPWFHFLGTAFIAFIYGTWYYSVEAEVHMAGLFFVAAGVYLLFFKPGSRDSLKHMALASFSFALAAGFHLTNGLIALSVLFIFIIEKKSFKKILQFFSCYLFFLLLMLAGSVSAVTGKLDLLHFYKEQLFGKDVLAGYKISYWTGFSFGSLWDSIKSVAHGLFVPGIPFLSFLSILLLSIAAALIIYAGIKSKNKTYYKLGLWLLPYFIFFTFWDHGNTEFKLNVILPFSILFIVSTAVLLQNKTGFFRTGVFTFIFIILLATFLINFYFYVKPANQLQNNRSYLVAEAIGKATPPPSVIVIGGCGSDLSIHNKIYISYFARRKTFILDWMPGRGLSLDYIFALIKQEHAKGTPVYFFSEILHESKTLGQFLKNHNLEAGDYFAFIKKMDFKEKIPLINGYYLKRLSP